MPTRTGYAASKHAVIGFFDSLRIELRGSGVGVTVVCPYFVRSEIHRRAVGPDGQALGTTPMKEDRIMTAENCAALTVSAMEHRRRMLVMTAKGKLGRFLKLVAPGARGPDCGARGGTGPLARHRCAAGGAGAQESHGAIRGEGRGQEVEGIGDEGEAPFPSPRDLPGKREREKGCKKQDEE